MERRREDRGGLEERRGERGSLFRLPYINNCSDDDQGDRQGRGARARARARAGGGGGGGGGGGRTSPERRTPQCH